ncbi:solute carrier family 23 protein [Arcanobacterium hippocoleae]
MLGGILNSFPYTCFAQNVGLVRITQVKSRWVAAGAGVIMLFIGLIPKAGAIVAAIPSPVLGGASLALFANVAWVGLQTIAKADMKSSRNAVIVTTALGLAMLVTFKPGIAGVFPEWAQIFCSSGMTIGAITAILLNLLFFHVGNQNEPISAVKMGKVAIDDINLMSREAFVATFRKVFNNQTWPLEQAWEARNFTDVLNLRAAIQEAVLTADPKLQHQLILDYPDMYQLIATDAEAAAEISQDIGSLALDAATDEELAQLKEISEQYREKFAYPWVAYLGIYDTPQQIIAQGLRRLENSPARERIALLSEITEIANDRFDKIVADANPIIASWESKYSN